LADRRLGNVASASEADFRIWPISTNWLERIGGSYLVVLLTQLSSTAFALLWIAQNALCFNAFAISWVAVEPE
jgi:hypothetical protein